MFRDEAVRFLNERGMEEAWPRYWKGYEAERKFTRSLHVLDPDGNEDELYVDVSDT